MRRREQLLLGATAAAAVGASTIDITGTPWASSQWVGDEVGQRETWARIVSGPGQGLHRRIIDNDSNTLTVFPSWTANGGTIPTTSSKFEIYAFSVRGLSIVLGNVAGGGHGMIQPNIWDNVAYKQPDTGQIYVTDPTVLGNNYLHPAFAPYRSFPWYMKTKVVGNTASWAVWVQGDPETSYSDSTGRAGSWTLEAADDVGFVDEPGMAGLYVAHMNASEYVEWDAMTVTRL